MPNFLALKQLLAPRLGMDETKSDQATLLNGFFTEAQYRIEAEMEWSPLEERDTTVAITSATTVLAGSDISSDAVSIVEIWVEDNSVTPDNRWKLTELRPPLPEAEWNAYFGRDPAVTANRNDPRHFMQEYASDALRWFVLPYPDADFTLHVKHRARMTELSADGDTNYWTNNYPHLLKEAAYVEGLKYLKKYDVVPQAIQDYREMLQRAIAQIEDKQSGPVRFELDPNIFKSRGRRRSGLRAENQGPR